MRANNARQVDAEGAERRGRGTGNEWKIFPGDATRRDGGDGDGGCN